MVLTMCRLLGFATAGSNTSLNGVLGMQAVCEFRDLSEVHNDGWGAALVTVPEESPYRRDGGAPSPETGTAIYKNTIAARHDSIFDELAAPRPEAACGICVWPARICR